jgi:cell shape-determining protein MreC
MNNENNILLNQLKEKDKIIKQLKEENEKLKNKCQIYEDKYIDIKSDNAILNEKINQIEGLLKSLNEI